MSEPTNMLPNASSPIEEKTVSSVSEPTVSTGSPNPLPSAVPQIQEGAPMEVTHQANVEVNETDEVREDDDEDVEEVVGEEEEDYEPHDEDDEDDAHDMLDDDVDAMDDDEDYDESGSSGKPAMNGNLNSFVNSLSPPKSRFVSGISLSNILPTSERRSRRAVDYASKFEPVRAEPEVPSRRSTRIATTTKKEKPVKVLPYTVVKEKYHFSTRQQPSRQSKSRKVAIVEESDEEFEEEFDEDDIENGEDTYPQEADEEEEEEEIEFILAVRDAAKVVGQKLDTTPDASGDLSEIAIESNGEDESTFEYLVKFKSRSYRMCTWLTRDQIEEQHHGASKIERFHRKFGYPEDFENADGVYYNPMYEEIDRIIAEATVDDQIIFFVKWKSLGYDQCTWEFESSLEKDHLAIEAFRARNTVPRLSDLRIPPRPAPHEFSKVTNEIMGFKDGNQLRPYQVEGLNQMVYSYYNRLNTILADEMGLGKTIQSVSTVYYVFKQLHNRGPFLILAPLSTVEHWKREIEEWTDMNCIVYHGNKDARTNIRDYEFYYTNPKTGKPLKDVHKFNVMITTYEICLQEKATLGRIHWQYLVVDEGHRLKNKNSKLLDTLQGFTVEHKLLLTGTPIQNDMGELFTLLNYLNPGKFLSRDVFIEKYGTLTTKEQVEELHVLIKPFLLRRMKEDVEKSIPPKEEIVVEMIPTTYQKTYYKAILEGKREFLKQGIAKKSQMPRLVNILMEVRKVCNHPFLIPGAEAQITKSLPPVEANEMLIRSSSKLIFTDKLLKHLKDNGHKVLIFSQMVKVLHILEDYLNYRNYKYVRLDGSIKGDIRQEAIDNFNDPNKDIFAFLISTRAGGVGINLMAADTVIIYDSDFNPQNDIQAQARCHRIGQKKEVKVYRLLTKDTKELDLFQKASRKLGLDRAVLNNISSLDYTGEKAQTNVGLDHEEIDTLLKHGAYVAYRDDTEEEKMLVEGDIEDILKTSSKVIRWDQGEKKDRGVSHFSKASFNFEEKSVDINDKDFWAKVLPQSRDVHGLSVILSTEGSLSTLEEKEQFFTDLSNLVERAIDQMSKFEWSAEHDDLGGLLAKVMYSTKLSGAQRDLAREWLEKVDKRLFRMKEREDMDLMDTKAEFSEEQVPTLKKGGWFKSEREKLFRGLTNLGWGKWEVFKERKCENKAIYEIKSMSEAMIQVLIDECRRIENLEVQVEKEATAGSLESKDEKIFKRRNYGKDISMLRALLMTQSVSEEPIESEKAEKLDIHVKFEADNTITAAKNITIKLPEDKSLLSPACRIEIIEQASDKEGELQYPKNKCVRMIDLTEAQWSKDRFKFAVPGYRGSFKIRLIGGNYCSESDTVVVRGVHPQCAEPDFITKIEKNHKTYVKRLRFSNNLTKVLNHFDHKILANDIPDLQMKSPTPWWDKECDADMLIGIASHGAGKFLDLKIDQTLCFQRKLEEFANSMRTRRERDNVDLSWPQTQILSKRIETIVDLMLKNLGLWEAFDSAGTVSMSREWAKTERLRFIRDLSLYGGHPTRDGEPNYGKLITSARLTKSPQYLKVYIKAFLKMCARVANVELTEDEKVEEDEDFLSVEKDVEEVNDVIAKRILERTRLLVSLAKYVFEDAKENMSKFHRQHKKKGSGLPLWYKVQIHDIELIQGVQKYGLDARAIMQDEDSIFAQLDDDQKRKMKDSLLLRRLDEFAKFMEKLHKCGSPIQSKSSYDCTPKRQKLGLEKSPKVKKSKKKKKKDEDEDEDEEKKEKKEKKKDKKKKKKKKDEDQDEDEEKKDKKKSRKDKKKKEKKESTSDSEEEKKVKKRKKEKRKERDNDSEDDEKREKKRRKKEKRERREKEKKEKNNSDSEKDETEKPKKSKIDKKRKRVSLKEENEPNKKPKTEDSAESRDEAFLRLGALSSLALQLSQINPPLPSPTSDPVPNPAPENPSPANYSNNNNNILSVQPENESQIQPMEE